MALDYLSLYFLIKSVVILAYGSSWIAIIILAYRFHKKRKHFGLSSPVMPGPKTTMFSIYGCLGLFPSSSTMKRMSLPPTAYVEQVICGLSTIFRKEKVIATTLFFKPYIVLNNAEAIEEFVRSNALVSKPFINLLIPLFGNGLFTSTGPKWKSRKRIFTPMFRYDILKEFVPKFDEESKVLVNVLMSRHQEKWIDIEDPIRLCSMDIVCGTLLGINLGAQTKENSKFLRAMTRATLTIRKRFLNPILLWDVIFNLTALGQEFREDIRYIRAFAEEVIRKRKEVEKLREGCTEFSDERKMPRKDILGVILDMLKANPDITEKEQRDELLTFIEAGQDTTSTAMCWALYLIGLYPEIQNKIHKELDDVFGNDYDRPVSADDLKEMSYLDCVLKESQRIYPAAPMNTKHVLEDFELCGYKIKKGSCVVMHPYSLHRNPEVFPNPEIFDPDRFTPESCVNRSPFAYIPFSVGPRNCIGRLFAVMEEKTVIANVLRNFSVKSLDHRDKMCTSSDLILRPLGPIKLKFTPRKC